MDRHRRIAGSASALLGLMQFALGAVTAPLVGLGDGASGIALAVTALVATVLATGSLLLARPALRATGGSDSAVIASADAPGNDVGPATTC